MAGGKKRQPTRRQAMSTMPNQASATQLVSWVDRPLTDNMKISPVVGQVWRTIKTVETNSVATQQVVAGFNAFGFTLVSLCGDYANLVSVFDQYKIEAIEVVFRPRSNVELVGTTSTTSNGFLSTVIDYDDATNLTAMQQAQNYDNCITTSVLQPQRRCFRPRVAVAAYSGAFTSFKNEPAGWIDAASTGVVHYGVKLAIDPYVVISAAATYDMFTRALIAFRASR